MRTFPLKLVVSSLLALTVPCQAQVFDEDYINGDSGGATVEGALGLHSDRMFRGQNLYNGVSIQPSAKLTVPAGPGAFYLRLFSHISGDQGSTKSGPPFTIENPEPADPEENPSDQGDGEQGDMTSNEIEVARVSPSFTEIDYTAGYEVDFDLFVLDVGHTWYTYSESTPRLRDTAEAHATVDFKVFANPYVTAAYEYDERTGWYYETGVRQPIPLGLQNDRDAVIPFLKLGMSNGLADGARPIYEDDGLAFVNAGLHAQFYIAEDLLIQPEVHYVEAIDDFADSELTFGMSLVGVLGR